jgi:hypothetical protein|tara:strand:+ start:6252 stop:6353 length:102 start_codon:yes stop_codon:yes gene_type:complete
MTGFLLDVQNLSASRACFKRKGNDALKLIIVTG